MKESLKTFAKLHPGLVGVEGNLQGGLFTQISLSVRVLLQFYKKCAASSEAWEIAKRNYKGTCNLDAIPKVIEKVKLDPKEKKRLAGMGAADTDWKKLQASAPKLSFWKVIPILKTQPPPR